MRFTLLLLLTLTPGLSQAFVSGSGDIVRTEKSVLVESWDNQADVTITENWQNETSNTVRLKTTFPTASLLKKPKVFWQSSGKTITELDQQTAAMSVYNLAKEQNNPLWLNVLSSPFDAWWQADDLVLPAGETATLKYQYTISLLEETDLLSGLVYLADGHLTQNLQVDLVRSGDPAHFLALPGVWEDERSSTAWARRWQVGEQSLNENLRFFISDKDTVQLNFNYASKGYGLDLQTVESTPPDRAFVILDRSGSVYGVRWERLQLAFKTLLETMAPSTQIRVGLAGKDLEWLDEEWSVNNRENQKRWIQTLEGVNVQGKSNWPLVVEKLEALGEGTDNRYALTLLGDFSDLDSSARVNLSAFDWKALMIDFWQQDSTYLSSWWKRFGGAYVKLFNSGYELAEVDLINRAWRQLSWRWPAQNSLKSVDENYPPQNLTTDSNLWATGQTEASANVNPMADFVPRWWAARKLASYLRESLIRDLTEDEKTAMASITNFFGVSWPTFSGDSDETWLQIQKLEQGAVGGDEVRFWQSTPFYLIDGGWQTRNWHDFNARFDRPDLELWSSAHQNLYLKKATQLAQPLSFGLVGFCSGQRCAQITATGRSDAVVTDTLLWDETSDHWALEPWAELVWKDVIKDPSLDYEQWAQPLSRGQFVAWLVAYVFPEADLPSFQTDRFSDITSEQVGATESLWLESQGLFKGYGDGTARLQQPLKRIEALKLLMTAQGLGIRDVLGNFDDKLPLSDLEGWTQPWGFEAYNRGLVKGYEDGTFRPFNNVTEAEAFKLLIESQKLNR